MSDPTTGHDPERPAGQPEPQDLQFPQNTQDTQHAQDPQDAEQPTERIDPVQPDRPTEQIGTGGPDASRIPDEPDTDADEATRTDARTPGAGYPEAGYPEANYPGTWDAPGTTAGPLPEPAEPRGVPLGTLVFGLVVVTLGLLILVSVLYDITLSGSAVAIALFLGAGLVLVIGGLVAARRSSRTNRPGA